MDPDQVWHPVDIMSPKTFFSHSLQEGVFEVPIKAVLPKYDIQVPETINFNMCAAKDFVEATFDVTNTG